MRALHHDRAARVQTPGIRRAAPHESDTHVRGRAVVSTEIALFAQNRHSRIEELYIDGRNQCGAARLPRRSPGGARVGLPRHV